MVDVDDELWDEFHRVVNMTSRELEEWLRTQAATEESEQLPDQVGTPTGREVLAVLGKRRGDLTAADEHAMRRVVDRVHAQRRDDLEPTAGQAAWRHKLMSIGHDPLKPVD
jgi:uncharacterized protein DUF3140